MLKTTPISFEFPPKLEQSLEKSTVKVKTNSAENIQVLWGVLILFLSAQLTIPLDPVPITLQTFAVMLLGLTFERAAAIKAILTYLSLGAMGVPVFAKLGAGADCFLKPSGGYLFGFFMAIVLTTTLRTWLKPKNFFHLSFLSLIGSITIYFFGILWLTRFMDLNKAISVGLMPFIIPGLVKILLLSLVVKGYKSNFIKEGFKELKFSNSNENGEK